MHKYVIKTVLPDPQVVVHSDNTRGAVDKARKLLYQQMGDSLIGIHIKEVERDGEKILTNAASDKEELTIEEETPPVDEPGTIWNIAQELINLGDGTINTECCISNIDRILKDHYDSVYKEAYE